MVFQLRSYSRRKPSASWKDYLGGPDSSHYSPLKQINTSNVNKIEVAWTYPAPDGTSVFCPLVVDNIAYVAAKGGALVALDATTGKELWVHPFGTGGGGRGGISGQRGANYWESKDRKDRRILVTSGGYLHAIDALTGKTVDSFADHGKLDLKTGIDRAPIPLASANPGTHFRESDHPRKLPRRRLSRAAGRSPRVRCAHRQAGVGVPHDSASGRARVRHLAEGRLQVHGRRGRVGRNHRRRKARHRVFPGRLPPKYELYGGDRPGNNLFADCLLALDARTGKYLWHFQTVHHDIWDYDPTAAPQLATVKHDGKTVDVVALASKNGFLYVFDRVTGKPLWPIEERPVPKSEVPGEWTSPTQPFPTVPPPFARQSMTEKDLYFGFMTPEEKAHWEERFANAQNKGLFTPPGLTDTISIPGVNGGPFFWDTGADRRQWDCVCGVEGLPVDFENGEGGGIDGREFGRHDPEPPQPGGGRGRGGLAAWRGGRPAHGAAVWAHDL